MNMSTYDGVSCWICSTPGSFCDCESTSSSWSTSASQASFCVSDGHNEPAQFDVERADEPILHTIHEDYFLASSFENRDFEIGGVIQCLRRAGGPQQPCAASTPKNNGWAEGWTSPGAIPPPESSSPVGLNADSSPFATDLALLVSCREGHRGVDRRDGGQWHVKASSPLFNYSTDAFIFPTTPWMGSSSSRTMPTSSTTRGLPDEPLGTMNKRQDVADVLDACLVTGRTALERTNDDGIERVFAPKSLIPASRKGAFFSGPTILGLVMPKKLKPVLSLSRDAVDEEPRREDATTACDETRRDDSVLYQMPSHGVSIISASSLDQATTDGRLKRRRSSANGFLESKKVKLDRTLSHVSCTSISSVQSKYRATKPASMRRAQSLKSEISACSDVSTDSLFYPSPLSSPTFRHCADEDYAPTEPSTPLPNSVDYARSKANPLARTLAVYRPRSLELPTIPKVPIIAPLPDVQPTVVRSAEDHAIERLEALLRRERLERSRDGLDIYDTKRTERLKEIYGPELSFSRRDSATTADSSVSWDPWEQETTRSETESQESQELAPSMKVQTLTEQYWLAGRGSWMNAFGIADDFRKNIMVWILEKIPKEPVGSDKDDRPRGFDLYDQLTNSYQTRFHAAQLFHRYFLSPEKVEYWREARMYERFKREPWGSSDRPDYESGVWDLAVACMALSVKLHRDCLEPLRPVYAAEFLEMAPHSMVHETFELAQRDILYTVQFQLGSCTPQDVLDELWNALPTLRKAAAQTGWTVVQRVTWDKLFESLLEPDTFQYPVTLLTAAALIESLAFALVSRYSTEAEVCKCQTVGKTRVVSERVLDDIESTSWQIHLFEANQLVDNVILDVRDVLHLTAMELDECRKWLSHVGQA